MASVGDTGRELVDAAAKRKQSRATWESHQADIADIVRPLRAELRGEMTPGGKRMQNVYDSTPITANGNFAGGLYGMLTNPADIWFTLGTEDPDLNKWGRVRDWLGTTSRRTLASFGPSWSAFYPEVATLFLDVGAHGMGCFSSEMNDDRSGFIDRCRPLSECVPDVDEDGNIDKTYRTRKLRADHALALIRKKGGEPSEKLEQAAAKTPDRMVDILHAVVPNGDYREGRIANDNHHWHSCYVEVDDAHVAARLGYGDFPFMWPRWEVAAGEIEGRGIGETILPDARSLQVMTKSNLIAGERAALPPWGAPDEGDMSVIRLGPDKINFGAFDRRGNQLLKPLMQGGNPPFSLEMTKALQEAIKDGFFFQLLPLLGRTGLGNIEVLQRNEQTLRLMGPYAARTHRELHVPLVMRRYNMLMKIGGVFPPAPPELAGRPLQVEMVSPMALAQRSARAGNVMRAAEAIGQLIAINPNAADKLNVDKAADAIGEGFSVPEIINDDETTQANRKQRQQVLAMQSGVAMAKDGAAALASAAQAKATAQQGGQQAAA